MRQLWLKFYEFLHFYGLFLPPFPRLDLRLYASRIEKRRFLLKSDYPLQRGCLKFAFETAPHNVNFVKFRKWLSHSDAGVAIRRSWPYKSTVERQIAAKKHI